MLQVKILDNLQITVKNIHIRYEDSISTPGVSYQCSKISGIKELSILASVCTWIYPRRVLRCLDKRKMGAQLRLGRHASDTQTC